MSRWNEKLNKLRIQRIYRMQSEEKKVYLEKRFLKK